MILRGKGEYKVIDIIININIDVSESISGGIY